MVEQKEDLDILEEVVGETWFVNAECRIEPIVGREYYLYRRQDGSSFISLVEPEYWDSTRFSGEFINRVEAQVDGSWKINEA
jgi:hypothetical protein